MNLNNIYDVMRSVVIHEHLAAWVRSLKDNIERMRKNCPEKLNGHKLVRLYVALVKVMGQVKADLTQEKYLLGNTLGTEQRDWRRAKEGLPPRYHLFFKFFIAQNELYFCVA